MKTEKKDEEKNNEEIKKTQNSFFGKENLIKKEPKIVEIFKKYKNKLMDSKSGLFLHPANYTFNSDEYKDLFEYKDCLPLTEKKEFLIIYDCLNYICYNEKYEKNAEKDDYYIKTINELFCLLKDKGTLLILIDQNFLEKFFPCFISSLGDNYKTKLFINFYFLDTHDFIFLISIQKMSSSTQSIILKDIKVLITDYLSNLNQKIFGSTTVGEFNTYLKEPLNRMKAYHIQRQFNYSRLKSIHPGQYFQMLLKSSPLNSEVSYIITIYDNSTNEEGKNKSTVSIAIGYEITQELLYSKSFSYDGMCQQSNVGRVIILESAILNPTGINDLHTELKDEIQLMKPNGFNEIVGTKVWNINNQKILIYEDEKYLIIDNEDKHISMRQLFYTNNKNLQNMVQSKIRIKFVSKSKINNSKGMTYYPIETQTKLKSKGVIECIDEYNILGFYEKCLLCILFYIDLNMLPKNTIKIMDIGAGIGVLSFYFYKLFKGCCEIDNIERNESIYNLGIKYFGLKNYFSQENRVNWFFEDVEKCLDKMIKSNEKKEEKKYENKTGFYDLICNEINDIEPKEDTVPSKKYFTDEFITNIKQLLKPYGIYTVNILSKSCKSLYENYLKLEKHFPTIFTINAENGLAAIFYCFNNKLDMEKFNEKFQNNKELMEKSVNIEFAVIKSIFNEVISRVQDMGELKSKFEEKAKNS